MKSLRTAITLAALVALVATSRLSAQDPEFKPSDLYDKCVKSSVFIVTPLKGGVAMGSGSLIDVEKRYVLTNYHVVDDKDMVFVQFPVRNKDGSLMTDKKKYFERIPAGQAIKGKILFVDKTRDLALIQLEKLPPDTPAMPLAKKSIRTGEPVINIGNPGAVDWTFSTTQGTVRGVGVADMVVGGGDEILRIKCRMVTITNPINPGDSGGPLIDRRGYQVGVCESGRSGVQNVNNCVDVTEVRAFLDQKKVTIKELSTEKDEVAPKDKFGPHSDRVVPKNGGGTPKKDPPGPGNGQSTDPAAGGTPPKVDPPAAAGPSDADEKAAADLLRRAKVFAADPDSQDEYKAKLKNVTAKYPGTAAAKEAKKILDGLK